MFITSDIIAPLAALYGTPQEASFEIAVFTTEYERIRRSQKKGRQHDVTLYIVKDGRIIVIAKHPYPPGLFRAPSGGIHPGEDFVTGAKREALEETGCEIVLERFLLKTNVTFVEEVEVGQEPLLPPDIDAPRKDADANSGWPTIHGGFPCDVGRNARRAFDNPENNDVEIPQGGFRPTPDKAPSAKNHVETVKVSTYKGSPTEPPSRAAAPPRTIEWHSYVFQARYVSGDFHFTDTHEIREVRLAVLSEFSTFGKIMRASDSGGLRYRAALHERVAPLLQL